MHALPNLAIQLYLVRLIRLGKVTGGDPGAEGGGVELVEGPRGRHMDERRGVWTSREGVPQGRGRGVVLAERGEAEDPLDGAEHGCGRVECAVDRVAAGGRGAGQEERGGPLPRGRGLLRALFQGEGCAGRPPRGRGKAAPRP